MGGLRCDALVALLKLALKAGGASWRAEWFADQDAGVKLATARHNSQVSQLLQPLVVSSSAVAIGITQSAGISALLAAATATAFKAMSTAIT